MGWKAPPFFNTNHMTYDSAPETWKHIHQVQAYMHDAVQQLLVRLWKHDQSKFSPEEKESFDATTPKLNGTTYGSDEYKALLKEIAPALKHHYANNSHHPEHYVNGVQGMTLLDLLEMLCDWKAATLRHADGDLLTSILKNQERFGYTNEMRQILLNTARELQLIVE